MFRRNSESREMRDKTVIRGQSKVLIIADQPVLRYGLLRLLAQESDLKVCGEAEDGHAALRELEATQPDLAAISLPLNNGSHHGLIEQLKARRPVMKILAAVRHDDPTLTGRTLLAGADGCIHWGEPLARIVEAIHRVLHGELHVGGHMAKKLLRRAVEGKPVNGNIVQCLSDRELDVFTMIGQGLTTQQIARRLDISPRTVESHRKKIKMKLGLQNAVQLNRHAFAWVCENAELV